MPPVVSLPAVRGLELTDDTFRRELVKMAQRLGMDAAAIAALMSHETGGTFSPSVQNPYSRATGLIQFMPSTARRLGTTIEDLARMSATEQLAYVERYLQPFVGKLRRPQDYYLVGLYPAAIGKPDSHVLFTQGSVEYAQNSALDRDKDGVITVADACRGFMRILDEAYARPPFQVDLEPPAAAAATALLTAGSVPVGRSPLATFLFLVAGTLTALLLHAAAQYLTRRRKKQAPLPSTATR